MHNSSLERTETIYHLEAGKQTPAQEKQLHLEELLALKIEIYNGR